ncbi:MAG: molybdate ABC transporter substrate-binding protein [Planctomycetales bacterium]|nr:molybdate ABC transporter substrate-binding protein [Planctomycetales bacterium]
MRRRRGAANSLYVFMGGSIVVLAALGFLLYRMGSPRTGLNGEANLVVYCAAGMKEPMESIARQYQDEFGVPIQLQYGGSNTLLNQIEVSKTGDLFLAADSSYIELARDKGLAAERLSMAKIRPVIAVAKGNDAIRSVADLLKPGVKIAMGNPDAAAVGKKTKKLLEKTGQWESLQQAVTERGTFSPTVNEVATAVEIGSVDAGIVWDSTVAMFDKLEAIHVPEFDSGVSTIEIAVLENASDPTAALRFARFAAARDRGLTTFDKMGFDVVVGDQWSEHPELTFFAGSVNRRALEPIINEFQQREGVTINAIYNGCGILTAQMRSLKESKQAGFPDTYMACDRYYLDTVQEMFEKGVDISDTDIVIVVQKGNPKNIQSLEDLAGEGLKIAIGQPDQCTIGVLSRRLLESADLYEKLFDVGNIATQAPTSAMLVPSVAIGTVDAALAYTTDTLAEADKVEAIRIDSPLAKAVQPFSVSLSSPHKQLGHRLLERIRASRDSFESAGFNWRLDLAGTSGEVNDPFGDDQPANDEPAGDQQAVDAQAARDE